MAKRQFHLSWFLSQGYGPKTWRGDWPGSDVSRWMMPDLFLDLARGMERAQISSAPSPEREMSQLSSVANTASASVSTLRILREGDMGSLVPGSLVPKTQ